MHFKNKLLYIVMEDDSSVLLGLRISAKMAAMSLEEFETINI